MKIKLLIFCSLFLNFAKSQSSFQKEYNVGATYVWGGHQTNDSGYVFLSGGYNVIKTDPSGNLNWSKLYWVNGPYSHNPSGILQTKDGGYLISGATAVWNGDSYLIKTDASGNLQWSKTYAGTCVFSLNSPIVRQTLDKGYLLGFTHRIWCSQGGWDAYVMKVDSLGTTLWSKRYVTYSTLSALEQTSDSGFVFASADGTIGNTGNNTLIKADKNGAILWTRSYANVGITSLQQTKDGGYAIGGVSSSHASIIKTNNIGDTLWNKIYAEAASSKISSLRQTKDGGYIVLGTEGTNGFLAKLNSTGDTVWTRAVNNTALNAEQTFDKGYVIFEKTAAMLFNTYDPRISKTDSLGKTFCFQNSYPFSVKDTSMLISAPTISTSTMPFPDAVVSVTPNVNSVTSYTNCIQINLGLENSIKNTGFLVYPNPVSDILNLEILAENEKHNIQIIDVLGNVVFNSEINTSKAKIDLSNFSSGIYFLKVDLGAERIIRKIIKE